MPSRVAVHKGSSRRLGKRQGSAWSSRPVLREKGTTAWGNLNEVDNARHPPTLAFMSGLPHLVFTHQSPFPVCVHVKLILCVSMHLGTE